MVKLLGGFEVVLEAVSGLICAVVNRLAVWGAIDI